MLSETFALSTQATLPGMINFGKSVTNNLNENTAIYDRLHGTIAHLALALSVRDFIEQVKDSFSRVGKAAVLA